MADESDNAPHLPRCVNGHRMLVGSSVCPVCSSPVRRHRPRRNRRADDPGRKVHAKVEAARTARDEDRSENTPGRIVAAATAALVLGVGGVAALVATNSGEPEAEFTEPFAIPSNLTCASLDIAEVLPDSVYDNSADRVCFTIDSEVVISVGAETTDGTDLALELTKADGGFIAAADDTYGTNPEVTTSLVPGHYVVEVTRSGGGDAGAFALYTTLLDPGATPDPSEPDNFSTHLPGIRDCGVSIPIITDSGTADRDSDNRLMCMEITTDAWVKFGIISLEESESPDLVMAVHRFDDLGRPRWFRSFDDAFGLDPEASASLTAGMYLIEVEEWNVEPPGLSQVYVDTTRSYFRVGDVSVGLEGLRLDDCESEGVRPLALGGVLGFEDAPQTYACLTLVEPTLVSLDVLGLAPDANLTLEVIGFNGAGEPRRYAWSNDDIFGQDITNNDPRIDTMLPEGTFLLYVAELDGGATGNFTLSATALE